MKQNEADRLADIQVVLLDIDGVLNEPQQPITLCMQQKLQQLARHKEVYFVTGNTYTKTVDILNGPIGMFAGVFCNNADELRGMRGKLIWQDTETPPLPPLHFPDLTANNAVEWRSPRFVNISRVGRYATKEQRNNHDASWRETTMAMYLGWQPEFECSIGGKVSIDIYSKGADKSRAAKYINDQGKKFIFIGDKTDISGNDYPVKKYCDENTDNICLTSSGPILTMNYINEILRI